MKKQKLTALLLGLLLLTACAAPKPAGESGQNDTQNHTQNDTQDAVSAAVQGAGDAAETIPFAEGQLYAAAYLGYETPEDLDYYADKWLDGRALPVHDLSAGEYYLIIPRYADTTVELYQCDMETQTRRLVFTDPNGDAFVLHCNISDIFPDAVIRLTYGEESVEFSPSISLVDGSVQIGAQGLLLTREGA